MDLRNPEQQHSFQNLQLKYQIQQYYFKLKEKAILCWETTKFIDSLNYFISVV